MIQYKNDDYRAWSHCYNFVAYNKEFLVTYHQHCKNPLFANYVNYVMYLYKKIINDDYVLYKYYEGVAYQYKKYSDRLWPLYYKGSFSLLRGNNINYDLINKSFDYDAIIQKASSELSSFLAKAEYEFNQKNEARAAFFIGQYFGNKELIKICKHFKKEKEN